MDAKKILLKVTAKETKERFTVSIDPTVLSELKRICGDRSVSAVTEEILREFIQSANTDFKKKP